MAKKVTITFKNPVNEAYINHMEVWWKLGTGGTYAQLGGDISFITGTSNYSVEDTSGNVADSANLYYEARAYNNNGGEVVGTDYNKLQANITISAVAANKALEFLEAQTDSFISPAPILVASDWYMDIRLKCTALSTVSGTGALMGSNTAPKCIVAIHNSEPYLLLGSTGGSVTGETFSLNTWYTIRAKYIASGTVGKWYMTTNDAINESTDEINSGTVSGLIDGDIDFNVGKYEEAGNDGNWQVDWVDFNGIKYELNEFVNTNQVEDTGNANQLTVTSDRADINDMLVTV